MPAADGALKATLQWWETQSGAKKAWKEHVGKRPTRRIGMIQLSLQFKCKVKLKCYIAVINHSISNHQLLELLIFSEFP